MKIVGVKLYVEDVCNPCDEEAVKHVVDIISEAFGKEEMQEHPRVKLILMEAKHTNVAKD